MVAFVARNRAIVQCIEQEHFELLQSEYVSPEGNFAECFEDRCFHGASREKRSIVVCQYQLVSHLAEADSPGFYFAGTYIHGWQNDE